MQQQRKTFSISDLKREFSVTLRALRYYESLELLHPTQVEGKTTRIYNRRDRARVKLILVGKRFGFSLAQIKEMIDLYDLDQGKTQRRVVLAKLCEQRLVLEQQLADKLQALEELNENCKILEHLERQNK